MAGQEMSLELLADIAIGPMARVELCRAHGEGYGGRLTAVKRLHPQLAREPGVVEALLADVWQAAALRHANAVEVLGLASDRRGAWVAYELVQGVSLARLIKTVTKTNETFHERMAVYIGWCVARALAAAQRMRTPDGGTIELCHQDLTPESVLVAFAGDVKVADFGWARTKRRLAGIMIGGHAARLVSPEEALGNEVDHRADIFSLGAMLYQLLASRPPWSADSRVELWRRIVEKDPTDLLRLRPSIDPELSGMVMRCLERDPKARFQAAGAVLVRLESWMAAHGYDEDNRGALSRFVRRNAMKQMRWFERALSSSEEEAAPRRPSLPRMRPAPAPEDIESSVTTDERPMHKRRSRRGDEARGGAARGGPGEVVARAKGEGRKIDRLTVPVPHGLPPAPIIPRDLVAGRGYDTPPPPTMPGEDTMVDSPATSARASSPEDEPSESEMTTQAMRRARHTQKAPGPPAPVVRAQPVGARRAEATAPVDPSIDQATLDREAERLKQGALRRAEEAQTLAAAARAASERAQRAAAIARKAHEAASIARDAARSAGKFGLAESARKLERALSIERATEALERRGPSVPPPAPDDLPARKDPTAAPAEKPPR